MAYPRALAISISIALITMGVLAYAFVVPYTSEIIFFPNDADDLREVRGMADAGWQPVELVGTKRVPGTIIRKAAYWRRSAPGMWVEDLLPDLGPNRESWANDLEGGQFGTEIAVGGAIDPAGKVRPIVWRAPYSWQPQGTPPWETGILPQLPGARGEARDTDLNLLGSTLHVLVVGWSENAAGIGKATAWVDQGSGFTTGTMDEEGLLFPPDKPTWAVHGRAGIADLTYLGVGAGENAGGQVVPAVWMHDGVSWTGELLPLLPGGNSGEARVAGVNNATGRAMVAGMCTNSLGEPQPVVWRLTDVGSFLIVNLPTLSGTNSGAILNGLMGRDDADFMNQGGELMTLVGWSGNQPGRAATLWQRIGTQWVAEELLLTGGGGATPYEAAAIDMYGRVGVNALPGVANTHVSALQAVAAADTDTTATLAYLLTPDPASAAESTPRLSSAEIHTYPNPFNPTVTITFRTAETGPATLTLHDARGAHVVTLFGGVLPAGMERSVTWDGRSHTGRRLASGVYFARLRAPSGTTTRKLVMLK